MFRHRSSRAGFTLIELIIVMAIMGILIAASASTFQTSRIKGKDGKRKSDLKQVSNALEAYMNDYGVYPLASSDHKIQACGAGTSTCDWGSAFANNNGTIYMAQLPSDANNGSQQYQYYVSGDQKMYQLFAALENTDDSSILTLDKSCAVSGASSSESETSTSLNCNYGISSQNTTPTQFFTSQEQ